MPKRSKRYQKELSFLHEKFSAKEMTSGVSVEAALKALIEACSVNFDPTVDLSVNLGIDPRKAEQNVRGFAVLPEGLGREVKVAVFARGPKAEEAKQAGADYVGAEDLVALIQEGKIFFNSVIATPDCMTLVAKVGKILGPKGLMPNPKTGTVTTDVANAVKDAKAGKVEFKNDKGGTIHVPVGKVSFGLSRLLSNIKAVTSAINRSKPQTIRGNFIKSAFLSHSQGPSVNIKISELTL
ncbi:MAG: 50S ribosomal protein L1 [Deltaproteobacteria bacterium]|nr:50S ribosomal protein L1 [Deltaproteobacteria bacterium]MCX7952873.1 50S ribosomal protein L1 [Deltaproteobacteria bacterium]